ncbi:hypothetical protein [Gallaecimonas mangrovi]|uniref:hypothetical protein n=1 Tax=Gallaecimonas mangrovi TaxID=2291597 RepID=UPI000E20588E|nr:hypothetical protein [Gallaecimonas mangrovi]
MAKQAPQRRADGIQKTLALLIVINLVLVVKYSEAQSHLYGLWALIVPVLLVVFNLILLKLALKRSRRKRDGAWVYLASLGIFILGFLVLRMTLM